MQLLLLLLIFSSSYDIQSVVVIFEGPFKLELHLLRVSFFALEMTQEHGVFYHLRFVLFEKGLIVPNRQSKLLQQRITVTEVLEFSQDVSAALILQERLEVQLFFEIL